MKLKRKLALLLAVVVITTILSGCFYRANYSSNQINTVAVQVGDESSSSEKNDNKKEFQNNRISVKVQYGLDGIVKANTYMPINLTIDNKGADLQGYVRIIVPGTSEKGIAYEKDFTLAKDTQKLVTIAVPSIGSFTYFKIEIVDDKDKVILSKNVKTGVDQTVNKALVGVLSDQYSALSYFEGLQITTNRFSIDTKILELSEETLPEDLNSLLSLNYIIVNDFDTSKLNQDQIKGIMNWVEAGGVLVLGTGSNYKKVFSGFPAEYLSGTIGEVAKEEITVLNGSNDADSVVVDSLDIKVDKGTTIKSITTNPTVHQVEKGKGAIDIVTFDLASKAITDWKNKGTLAKKAINAFGTSTSDLKLETSMNGYGNVYWSIGSTLDFYRGVKLPSTLFYGILFLVYIMCVGPIGYFILKKRDKRERIWAVIPIAASVFTLLVFLLSSDSRIKEPIGTTFSIIQSSQDSVEEEVFISLQSPNSKKYNVQLAKGFTNLTPLSNDNYYNGYDQNQKSNFEYKYAVKENNKGSLVSFEKGKSFTKQMLQMSKADSAKGEKFDLNLKASLDGITGSVVNNTGYDLKEAILYYNGMFASLKDFNKGETKNILKKDIKVVNNLYAYDLVQRFLPPVIYNKNNKEEFYEYNNVSNMYNYLASIYMENSPYQNGYVFGVVKDFNKDYIVSPNVMEQNQAVVVQEFVVDLSDVGEVYVPNINRMNVRESKGDLDPYGGYLFDKQGEVIYSFESEEVIEKLVLVNRTVFKGKIYAYNNTTSVFDEIFVDSEEMNEKELEPYMTSTNTIQIKYEQMTAQKTDLPVISAMGRNK